MDRSRVLFSLVGISIVVGFVVGALALRPSTDEGDPSAPSETSTTSEVDQTQTSLPSPITTGTWIDADPGTTEGMPPPGPDDDCIIGEDVGNGVTITTVVRCADVPTTAEASTDQTVPPEPPVDPPMTSGCHFATTVPGGTLPSPQCEDQ